MDWLSVTLQRALQRRASVNLLKGTSVQPMADELGFWAYRLDNAFPEDMHNSLVILMNETFDPHSGFLRLCTDNNKEVNQKFDYKVLNLCKHPRVCADTYAYISKHPIWQWGSLPAAWSLLHRTSPTPSPRARWWRW